MSSIHPAPTFAFHSLDRTDCVSLAAARYSDVNNFSIDGSSKPPTAADDPLSFKFHQSRLRKHLNFDLILPLTLVAYVVGAARFNLQEVGSAGPFFSASFVSLVATTVIFLPHQVSRIILHYTATENQHRYYYKFCEQWNVYTERFNVEDLILILADLTAGFVLLGRVYAGQCADNFDIWATQTCNPFANVGSIPHDQVILIYLIPIMVQNLLRRISVSALVVSWVICVTFVIVASIHVGGWLQIWTVLYSSLFIIITFMIERLTHATFLQGQDMVAACELRAKHQLELLELTSESERKLREKEVLQLQSLIGNVAHDLKTPLHSIEAGLEALITFISKIPKAALDEAKQKFCFSSPGDDLDPNSIVDTLTATCKFMEMAISRSEDFTKASNNIALVPTIKTFTLESVLATSMNCINNFQSGRLIAIHSLDPKICSHIMSDRQWLTEDIICLLSNALKYSNFGRVDLRVKLIDTPTYVKFLILEESKSKEELSDDFTPYSVEISSDTTFVPIKPTRKFDIETDIMTSTTDAKLMILITVEDIGIGITDDARKYLFKPMKHAHRMVGGTGLGLYSLSMRVDALGGYCGVADRPDGKQGSMFWFTFPYRPDQAARDHFHCILHQKIVDTITPLTEISKSRSILVVDDSLTVLKVTSRLLRINGHKTKTAANGLLGLNMLKEVYSNQEFDMVLTDIQMPVMDGIEATLKFREFEEMEMSREIAYTMNTTRRKRKRLLIVGMSANSEDQCRRAALESGMDFFLPKPFSFLDLEAIMLNN